MVFVEEKRTLHCNLVDDVLNISDCLIVPGSVNTMAGGVNKKVNTADDDFLEMLQGFKNLDFRSVEEKVLVDLKAKMVPWIGEGEKLSAKGGKREMLKFLNAKFKGNVENLRREHLRDKTGNGKNVLKEKTSMKDMLVACVALVDQRKKMKLKNNKERWSFPVIDLDKQTEIKEEKSTGETDDGKDEKKRIKKKKSKKGKNKSQKVSQKRKRIRTENTSEEKLSLRF